MKRQRIKGIAEVRLDAYRIIDEKVENAVRYGYARAYKHVETPSEDQMIEAIHRAVMNDLCDILKFDEE